MRQATIKRTTLETKITTSINLDSTKTGTIDTGIPFFDHMLTLFQFHAHIALSVKAEGDLEVDTHHTIEDIGITLGQALKKALSDNKGIQRYADNLTPMDESLIRGALDISGRATLVYQDNVTSDSIGTIASENFKEFFTALTHNAFISLHLMVLYGENNHHKIEGIFKSFGRLLNDAIKIRTNTITSTKGVI